MTNGTLFEPVPERDHGWRSIHEPAPFTGVVDFVDSDQVVQFSVFGHPSTVEDDTTVVQIDTPDGGKYKIMLNDGCLFNGDIDKPTRIEEVLAEVLETRAGKIGTHSDDCYTYHAGCLAALIQDLINHNEGN